MFVNFSHLHKLPYFSFDEIKIVVEKDILLAYPNFNKRFNIHTYASDYQIGAVIIQEGIPIVFYIQNLTGPHNRYTVTKR